MVLFLLKQTTQDGWNIWKLHRSESTTSQNKSDDRCDQVVTYQMYPWHETAWWHGETSAGIKTWVITLSFTDYKYGQHPREWTLYSCPEGREPTRSCLPIIAELSNVGGLHYSQIRLLRRCISICTLQQAYRYGITATSRARWAVDIPRLFSEYCQCFSATVGTPTLLATEE